ncbi:MAG: hypothetical protein KF830_03485 [Planctomycetes bacterium]|nr:hypothetical protein [Planctomycetota bacterium]
MNKASLLQKRLVERLLAGGGEVPLALLLELLVPVARLRELARQHGLSPKGGFRIEHAPAHVLGPLLAEQTDATRLEAVLALLVPASPGAEAPPAPSPAPDGDLRALLALREAELARSREDVGREREAAARARERAGDLERRLGHAEQELTLLRATLARRDREAAEPDASRRDDRDLQRRVRELEAELDGLRDANAALARQRAYDRTRIVDLEQRQAELEQLVPKSRRQQRQAEREAEPPPAQFRLPIFTPGFYKSLAGKERSAVERAVHAVLQLCTEGYGYPGLEVKQLGGQDTWSLRASLGLRVYFRPRADGDVEILELADREDQHTTLRRLKDR